MNCANHPDRPRAAFCQSCGKPLCTECVRNVGTSVFCEQCLAARVAGTAPPAGGYAYTGGPGFAGGPAGYPPAGAPIAPGAPGEPSPGVAALLGFIPGVGAMYNGQYAKGIVHLIVFAVLTSLADNSDIFGIFVAGWIAYMVIEAHHTARARRDGTPLPNPFGLNDLGERLGFGRSWPAGSPGPPPYGAAPGAAPAGDPANPNAPPANAYAPPYSYVPPASHWGAPYNAPYSVPPNPPAAGAPPAAAYPDANLPYYRRFPTGAIWLIALGVFFLVGNIRSLHLYIFHGGLSGAIFMIGLGVWLFVRRMTNTGQGFENDGTALYRWRLSRALSGSFWLFLIGFVWLLRGLGIVSWAHSWPIYLIGAGVMMFFRRTLGYGYGYGYPPYPVAPPSQPQPAAPVTTTEIVPADPMAQVHNYNSGNDESGNSQEGR